MVLLFVRLFFREVFMRIGAKFGAATGTAEVVWFPFMFKAMRRLLRHRHAANGVFQVVRVVAMRMIGIGWRHGLAAFLMVELKAYRFFETRLLSAIIKPACIHGRNECHQPNVN